MRYFYDMKRSEAVLDSLEVDALAFAFCFRRGNNAVGVWMMRCWTVDIG